MTHLLGDTIVVTRNAHLFFFSLVIENNLEELIFIILFAIIIVSREPLGSTFALEVGLFIILTSFSVFTITSRVFSSI